MPTWAMETGSPRWLRSSFNPQTLRQNHDQIYSYRILLPDYPYDFPRLNNDNTRKAAENTREIRVTNAY